MITRPGQRHRHTYGPRAGLGRLLRTCLAVLFLCLPALPAFGATGDQSRNPGDKVIIVGGNRAYPPYEFLDKDGQPAGYNVDLTRAIAKVMGMKVEFRFGAWSEMRTALMNGEIDVLQGISFSEERLGSITFSPPHTIVHHAIFARKDTKPVNSIQELHGKEIIVFRDGIMHDSLRNLGFSGDLHFSDTPADALRLLASGAHDYAVVAILPGMYLIRELHLTNVVPVATSIAAQKYCYGVRKGNDELMTRISEGLAILHKTGQYQAIYDKWLGTLEPPPVSWERAVRYGALALVLLLLILAATVVWSRTLQKRVALRTQELARESAERKRALEELRRHQDKLIQADKMASLGILVSGVAHEINNPNGLILLNMPILKEVYQDAVEVLEAHYHESGDFPLGGLPYSRMRNEVPHMLDEMLEGSKRIKRIVEELKDFARQDDNSGSDLFDLNQVAQAAVRLVDSSLRKATVNFSAEYAADIPQVRGNTQRIEQVVVNLLLNACQALPNTECKISLATFRVSNARIVALTITDEGVGIASEHIPRLTDPFFTTKRETGGTGLGLSVSAGIVNEHGGTLKFTSAPGAGTTVILTLPAAEETT
ncbi:transporter substrate-binding domain-containing protein [Oryzomonas japonica]|uniref:histidine kinase n=1 Tax=Oryzomonas japonica TaxID=2603858 RepID=A0A7J4ZTC6_9BACT|nr:transporter substrate-binding domain-containing protein [Oryzomonas japonica]